MVGQERERRRRLEVLRAEHTVYRVKNYLIMGVRIILGKGNFGFKKTYQFCGDFNRISAELMNKIL